MKKLLLLLVFIPFIIIGQTNPADVYDQAVQEAWGNTRLGYEDVNLKWSYESDLEKLGVKLRKINNPFKYPSDFGDVNPNIQFIRPVLNTASDFEKKISFSYYTDLLTGLKIEDYYKVNIEDNSYTMLKYKLVNVVWTQGSFRKIIARNTFSLYRFCYSENCTRYLTIDRFGEDGDYLFGFFDYKDTGKNDPIIIDLQAISKKLKTNNSDDIHYSFSNLDNKTDLIDFGKYQLVFENFEESMLESEERTSNYKFSLDDDFEFSFGPHYGTQYLNNKSDLELNIWLGYKKVMNGRIVDPQPEIGSSKYHLKLQFKQLIKGYIPETTFNIEKYYKGIKVLDKSSVLKQNYFYSNTKENQIKISKIDGKVFLSINGDLVYAIDEISFQNDNIIITHNAYHKQSRENLSKIRDIVFAMPESDLSDDNSNINNSSVWTGSGSGFLISNEGYIVTNFHVIENATEIGISLNKNEYNAEVVISDRANDLAILKIKDPNFKIYQKIPYNIKLRSSDVGTQIFTLGFPMALSGMGEEIKFTDGRISSKSGYDGDYRLYQTTAPIQEGNSGGPLFDYNGNLIGVNSSKISSNIADNVSYSIKSSFLMNLVDGLQENINFSEESNLKGKPLTEIIKILSDFVVLIKIK